MLDMTKNIDMTFETKSLNTDLLDVLTGGGLGPSCHIPHQVQVISQPIQIDRSMPLATWIGRVCEVVHHEVREKLANMHVDPAYYHIMPEIKVIDSEADMVIASATATLREGPTQCSSTL